MGSETESIRDALGALSSVRPRGGRMSQVARAVTTPVRHGGRTLRRTILGEILDYRSSEGNNRGPETMGGSALYTARY